MKYIEVSLEEAIKRCKKNVRVLVAEQDLEDCNVDMIFVSKAKKDLDDVFKGVQTVASLYDDFVNQLKLFTEKQDIRNIRPYGIQRTVILRE